MSATVTSMQAAQVGKTRQEPYAFFFAPYVSALDDQHHFTKTEWRLIAFAFGHLDYGQQFWDSSLTALGEEMGLARPMIYRAVGRLIKLGVFYKQHTGSLYPELYLSSYVAYRGKMKALKHFRHIEDMVKRGETHETGEPINLEYNHAYLGEVPDVSWPEWLIEHCMEPSEEDYARAT